MNLLTQLAVSYSGSCSVVAGCSATWLFTCCSCWITEFSALAGWWWSLRETRASGHLFVLHLIQLRNPSAESKEAPEIEDQAPQSSCYGYRDLTSPTYPAERRAPWRAGISNFLQRKNKIQQISRKRSELQTFSSSFKLTTVKLSQVAANRDTSLDVFSFLS